MAEVYLVGAGAGDVELLTLQALKILQKADVILYDALVSSEVLEFAKMSALLINVGKRKANHSKKQEEINQLLQHYSKSHDIVVRLKGGTPFVFGRGYEEVRALEEVGITPTIISGVSSTTSVPESFMIPLIDRVYNDSYRTITGHDIELFSQIVTSYHPRESLVVMMGVYNLQKIVQHLLSVGYPRDISLAILSKGTTPQAKKKLFTLEELSSKEEEFFVTLYSLTPAILFIGNGIY